MPLSVFLFFFLVDGTRLSLAGIGGSLGVIVTVGSMANYGYALNELFDVDEDRRGGRSNAAADMSPASMWLIIIASGACAFAAAAACGGWKATALTALELLLPLTYSLPPVRTKERGWIGIASDALAAHVYPAMLVLIVVEHLALRSPAGLLVFTMLVWSLGTGLRGIISHQLQSAEHDQAAGLSTIVHRFSHRRIATFVVLLILPIEIGAFSALVMQSAGALLLKAAWLAFVVYECLKFALNVFPVIVFTRRGQRYIPFVDEGFYKVWGSLAALADAALFDARYLAFMPAYILLFWPRVRMEWQQVRTGVGIAYRRLVPTRRSS